jgi:hypothetical protein
VFHEYVYLSNDKVREFLPSEQSWWSRIRTKKFGGKAGGAGVEVSLEFEPSEAAASHARLEKIRDHISEVGRWYQEDDLTSGEWVFFEGRIGYQALEEGAVLFCESGGLTAGNNRIVLHGSAANLVGRTVTAAAPTSVPAGGFSDPGGAASVLEAAIGRTTALEVAERLFWRQFTDPKKPFASRDSLDRHVKTLFTQVACTDSFRNHAPFLVGCARITTVVKPSSLPFGVVVASPLFVRRARP